LHHYFNLNFKDLEYVVRLVLVPACYRKDKVSFFGSLDLDDVSGLTSPSRWSKFEDLVTYWTEGVRT
jgi:hypothetical protein